MLHPKNTISPEKTVTMGNKSGTEEFKSIMHVLTQT